MLSYFDFQQVIWLKQYKMAKIQSKNLGQSYQIRLKKRKNISGFKTNMQLRSDKKLYEKYLKKKIASAQQKFDKEESKLDIKTKLIAKSLIEIFELPL